MGHTRPHFKLFWFIQAITQFYNKKMCGKPSIKYWHLNSNLDLSLSIATTKKGLCTDSLILVSFYPEEAGLVFLNFPPPRNSQSNQSLV